MAQIAGRLLADLHPNGTVRIVFIASVGGGNETPFTAESLDLKWLRSCSCACSTAPESRGSISANSKMPCL